MGRDGRVAGGAHSRPGDVRERTDADAGGGESGDGRQRGSL